MILALTAHKFKCPRHFWEIDPEFLHTCLICPCRAFDVFFFSLELWDQSRPKYPKTTKTQISGAKNENRKKPIRKRLGMGTLNTCAKFQGQSLKNGVDNFGVLCLNQPVRKCHIIIYTYAWVLVCCTKRRTIIGPHILGGYGEEGLHSRVPGFFRKGYSTPPRIA